MIITVLFKILHPKQTATVSVMMSKPEMMGDQEYLDRRYEWDINIRIGDKEENGYIALSITINNWTYWFQPTDM